MTSPIVIKVPSKRTSYVAVDSETNKVVAHGTRMKAVIEKARKSKTENFGIMFVPKQGQHYIY